MAENSPGRLWAMRLAYCGLMLAIMFAHLMPLHIAPRGFAGPDLLVTFTFAWALRRPDYVPAMLIALMLLLADLLLQRPPGLWAVLVLMGAEWLKGKGRHLRENTFAAEWLTFAATLLAITALYRVILSLLIVSPGTFFLSVMQYGLSVLAYPLVAGISYLVFGVRRSTPGEYDHTGRTL
ncbi:hypothetical protein [Tropicibacter naphthalenivorans]|uniref:Rod shape-determining protein MreD n=1 Tax=Tropicibacter naphthalenivorans TaxID=441103 RepID=A0A0P1G8S8_9RHOB|nr:hypothetical protein [Tropicibacter naphthalenivorans]CUH77933.1 hypothetical protein TRN7648_01703 [Tropicibacter naphthalenivorans]SMC95038.1 rod shape-determining protein MreD [Tropicibacter naphthalenivorans]